MRGGLQLGRNIAFAVVKVLALPSCAFSLHDRFGVGITLSWVTGMALSLALVAVRLWLAGKPVLAQPDWGVLRGLGRTAMAHNWLNLAMTMPFYFLPVLVTVIVSPSANAAFYIATMLAAFLALVPIHLSTVLFAVVAANPQVVARKLRFALRVSFMIGLPGMAVLIMGAHLALGLFGKGYAASHAAAVPDGPGVSGDCLQGPLHRGLPGGRPDTPGGGRPDDRLVPRNGCGGGGRAGRRAEGTVVCASGRAVCRGIGDDPAGDPRRLRPRPALACLIRQRPVTLAESGTITGSLHRPLTSPVRTSGSAAIAVQAEEMWLMKQTRHGWRTHSRLGCGSTGPQVPHRHDVGAGSQA